MTVQLLAAMPWTAVRECVSPRAVAVLPLGAIEAHGPHLPLATDVIIAEAMAREGAVRLSSRGFEVTRQHSSGRKGHRGVPRWEGGVAAPIGSLPPDDFLQH